MTANDLIRMLTSLKNRDAEVLLLSDPEGNKVSKVYALEEGLFSREFGREIELSESKEEGHIPSVVIIPDR